MKVSKNTFIAIFRKYWVVLALIFIIVLSTEVRLLDYRWPYLRNIDSYNFAQEMEAVVKYGYLPGYDYLKLAPIGTPRGTLEPYPYISAYSFMFYRLFNSGADLYKFLVWFSPFLLALTAIPIYFIGKTLYDKRAGLIAAAFYVFDPSIVARTLGGDPDNDNIVLLMPLIVIALFLYTYRQTQSNKITKKNFLLSVITGIAMALFFYTWGGYWFVIWLITGFILLKVIFNAISKRSVKTSIRDHKALLVSFFVMLVAFFALTASALQGFGIISATISGPINFPSIKSEAGTFPNVYVSVAELQSPSGVKAIIDSTGIAIFALVAAVIYLLYSYAKKRKHLDTMILLGIWFVGPFLATIVAIRFTILFTAPIAIGTGILFTKIIRMITKEDTTLSD